MHPYLVKTASLLILASLTLFHAHFAAASSTSLQQLRSDYTNADRLIQQGRITEFDKLAPTLREYPLYPYLLFARLRRDISNATPDEVDRFLTRYADLPLAYRLRHSWLYNLKRKGDWDGYLKYYRETSSRDLQCYYYQALIHTRQVTRASSDIDDLWLSADSLPDSCDPVLKFWNEQGLLTADRVWARISLAMRANRSRLAKHLMDYLPEQEKPWMETWYKVHHKPQLLLRKNTLRGGHPRIGDIIVHGIRRLASADPLQAIDLWQKLEHSFSLTQAQHAEINRAIGLKLAYRGHADAISWLSSLPELHTDRKIREWRIRVCIRQGEWKEVLYWISQLPEEERSDSRWQYWSARAHETLGEPDEAREIYTRLAGIMGFDGFLAAEKIGTGYAIIHKRPELSAAEMEAIQGLPAIIRARELYYTDNSVDARREWYQATRDMNDRQLQAAARLAHTWGWHERAILTMGRSSYRDDLELRFPLLHADKTVEHARQAGVEPAWALAVIRQESAFAEDARSHRNARGLMQLLPRTARAVARSLKSGFKRVADLYKAEVNINLGVHYLKTLLTRFQDNMVLATAAYNAGSYRVHRWQPGTGSMDADIWIETIPFNETRNYVRRVLAYTVIYEHRLGSATTPLGKRMQEITPYPSAAQQQRSQNDG